MKKILILGTLLVGLLFLSACDIDPSKIDLSKVDTDKLIKCESPYIRVGTECCVDQDNNKICDKDERELTEKEKKEEAKIIEEIPEEETVVIEESKEEPTEESKLIVGTIYIDTDGFHPNQADIIVGSTLNIRSIGGNHKLIIEGVTSDLITDGNAYSHTFNNKGSIRVFDIITKDNAYINVVDDIGIEPEEKSCGDECSSDSCSGLDYTMCLMKSDGCRHKEEKGKIVGKCGVECLDSFDCDVNEKKTVSCENYKCEYLCIMSPTCHNGDLYHRNSCTDELEFSQDCKGNGCESNSCVVGIFPSEVVEISSSGFDQEQLQLVIGSIVSFKSVEGRHKLSIEGTVTPVIEEGKTYEYTFNNLGEVRVFDIFSKESIMVGVYVGME